MKLTIPILTGLLLFGVKCSKRKNIDIQGFDDSVNRSDFYIKFGEHKNKKPRNYEIKNTQKTQKLINSNKKLNIKCSDFYNYKFQGIKINKILQIMKSGQITNIIPSKKTGSTVKFTIYVKQQNIELRTFFKPKHRSLKYTNPQGEVAAFRIAAILNIHTVPPAVLRTLSSSELLKLLEKYGPENKAFQFKKEVLTSSDKLTGAMLLWIHHVKNFNKVKANFNFIYSKRKIPTKNYKIVKQLTEIMAVDYLTSNYDRFSGGNILREKHGDILYFIDNGAAFGFEKGWDNAYLHNMITKMKKISIKMYKKLKNTPNFVFQKCLSDVLDKKQIENLLKRKKFLLSQFEKLQKI